MTWPVSTQATRASSILVLTHAHLLTCLLTIDLGFYYLFYFYFHLLFFIFTIFCILKIFKKIKKIKGKNSKRKRKKRNSKILKKNWLDLCPTRQAVRVSDSKKKIKERKFKKEIQKVQEKRKSFFWAPAILEFILWISTALLDLLDSSFY